MHNLLKIVVAALALHGGLGENLAQINTNNYFQAKSGVVRVQGSAMINSNTQTSMTVLNVGLNQIVQSVKVSKTVNMNATNLVINVQVLTFYMAVYPIPKVAVRQQILNLNSSQIHGAAAFTQTTTLTQTSWAMAYPALIEYAEGNGVAGFQLNSTDTVAQTQSLVFLQWNPFTTTTTNIAATATSAAGQLTTLKACTTDAFVCFTFKIASVPYTQNAMTFVPNSVKVDVMVTPNAVVNANDFLAVLASQSFTGDMIQLMDLHKQVDAAVAQASTSGQVAYVSPDIVFQYNTTTNAGFLNWNRVLTTTLKSGNTTTTQVVATVVGQSTAMVSYDQADYGQDVFASMTTQRMYVVYSFIEALGNVASFNWDPELGIDTVSTSNAVGPASGPTQSTGSSVNVAGAVIGVLAAVGVVAGGVFYYRRRQRKSTDGAFLAMS